MNKDMECLSLKELRERIKKESEEEVNIPDMDNDCISRLENSPDILVSMLEKYIQAMGGKLTMIASFPNRKSVCLSIKKRPSNESK